MFSTIDPAEQGTLVFEQHSHRLTNDFGRIDVEVVTPKVPNEHGYGFHYEHPSTIKSRALKMLRDTLGPEWVIATYDGVLTAGGDRWAVFTARNRFAH
jgi:hypothetical protein